MATLGSLEAILSMARIGCRIQCRIARLAILGIGLAATSAHADATLDVMPQSIAMATIEKPATMNARLRLRAPAEAALRDIRLASFSNDGIFVKVSGGEESAKIDILAPNDEHIWAVQLTASRPLAKKAHVIFEIAVDEDPEADGEETVRRHFYATLEVEPPSADLLTSMVSMEIEGGDGMVSRQRPGTIYVVLRNQRDIAVQVGELQWYGPGFIELRAGSTNCEADVPPSTETVLRHLAAYQQMVVPMHICPGEQIVPGKYNLLATVSISMGDTELAVLSANREVQVGIIGESELLNLLGVPSLLLLPGFLLLITWRILRSLQGVPADTKLDLLKPKEADFWAIAIALSLGFAFVYPWVTQWLLPEGRRDYLVAYGLRDLVYVYSAAIVLGILIYGAWQLLYLAAAAYKTAQLARSVPSADDGAVAVLEKLVRAKGMIDLPVAHLKETQPDRQLFVLSPWTTDKAVWLTPPICLKIQDRFANADEGRDALNALQRVTTAGDLNAATACQIVKEGEAKGWWTADWGEVGAIKAPISKEPDVVETLDKRGRLITESP